MTSALREISRCGDIGSLESTLRTLCSTYGAVSRLDVLPLTGAGKHRAVCLVRLDSSEREQDLMAALGASRFDKNIYLIVNLSPPNT